MANLGNLKPWKPGQSGNPNGRPRKKVEERAVEMLSNKVDDDTMSQLFDVLINNALKGHYRSMELVMAYLMGKPLQRVQTQDNSPLSEALGQILLAKREEAKLVAETERAEKAYTVIDVSAIPVAKDAE